MEAWTIKLFHVLTFDRINFAKIGLWGRTRVHLTFTLGSNMSCSQKEELRPIFASPFLERDTKKNFMGEWFLTKNLLHFCHFGKPRVRNLTSSAEHVSLAKFKMEPLCTLGPAEGIHTSYAQVLHGHREARLGQGYNQAPWWIKIYINSPWWVI